MDKLGGHVAQIESANYKLNGFLNLFANLPVRTQTKILREVAELKAEAGGNEAELVEKVKALAALYGALEKTDTGTRRGDPAAGLTFQLGQIQTIATELGKLNKKPEKGN